MNFKQGGQAIQRIRKERGMTQEQLAELTGISSNSISRIERGALIPALPTLIELCNALEVGADAVLAAYLVTGTPIRWTPLARKLEGADAVLAAYLVTGTPIRWTPLARKLEGADLEKQRKIEAILDCLMETI